MPSLERNANQIRLVRTPLEGHLHAPAEENQRGRSELTRPGHGFLPLLCQILFDVVWRVLLCVILGSVLPWGVGPRGFGLFHGRCHAALHPRGALPSVCPSPGPRSVWMRPPPTMERGGTQAGRGETVRMPVTEPPGYLPRPELNPACR